MTSIRPGIEFIWNRRKAKNYAPKLDVDMKLLCVMRSYGGVETALVRNKKTGVFYEASGGMLKPMTDLQEELAFMLDRGCRPEYINTGRLKKKGNKTKECEE